MAQSVNHHLKQIPKKKEEEFLKESQYIVVTWYLPDLVAAVVYHWDVNVGILDRLDPSTPT